MSVLTVGVQLPEVERDVRWPEYVSMARAAENVGFGSIWLGDHLLYRGDGREERGPWEAWTMLSALAAVTERVRLGPLVACASFHPPVSSRRWRRRSTRSRAADSCLGSVLAR
jgi:alkanesulfonate monooxygenase SsuD/methylene tetrahydromethanopterin reductase-like flavin-dependent oxidoreductase (luciferase family)